MEGCLNLRMPDDVIKDKKTIKLFLQYLQHSVFDWTNRKHVNIMLNINMIKLKLYKLKIKTKSIKKY